MRPILRTAIITLIFLGVAIWAIIPPKEKLRLGKDLRGGASLVYSVQIKGGEDAKAVLAETIDVLRKRVDPDGLLEIAMVPQGRDRIEITMPLPNDEVKALKKAFEDELAKLGRGVIRGDRLDQLLQMAGDQREAEIQKISGGVAKSVDLLRAAAIAWDASKARRAELEAAKAAGKSSDELDPLVDATALAEKAADDAVAAVIRAAVSPEEVRRALLLSSRERTLRDEKTGEKVSLGSARDRAIKKIRESHPESSAELDAAIKAYDTYTAQRRSLDDPQDLVRMLRGAGVLSFRITIQPGWNVQEESRLRQELVDRGPRNVRSSEARWYKINDISTWYNSTDELRHLDQDPAGFFRGRGYVGAEYNGEYFLLCWDTRKTRLTTAEGVWKVARSYESRDELGRPCISFEMDPRGGVLLGELTKDHVKQQMAVLLDDQIYTAPTLQSAISKSGQITGDFDQRERQYVIRTLAAGSLQAKLSPEPLSVSVLGPDMGFDNLRLGLKAGLYSFVVCAGFLIIYYFTCGGIAFLGLLVNCLLLLGAMALNRAAFTLPGIAGVILTFAMAVDSNVLVFERMREEITGRGADLRTAVRLGYSKAMSAIVDGNLTNLIVCLVLGFVGTPEIKGFAITMGIGVLTTLFAQLTFTRLIFDVLIEKIGWRKTSMLPMAVPAVQRAFTLNVDWMKYRGFFYAVFLALIGLAVTMIVTRGSKMLDTEFVGGTAVTLRTGADQSGKPKTLKRQDVADRLSKAAEAHPDLAALRNADVQVVNPEPDGVTSHTFTIKTSLTDSKSISGALSEVFADVVDARQRLRFDHSDAASTREAPAYPILSPVLGQSIDRPAIRLQVQDFIGGLAILVEDIDPPQPLGALRERLDQTRAEPEFASTLGRAHEIQVIDGSEDLVRSAVILVRDENINYFSGEGIWASDLRDTEWAAVVQAAQESTTFLNVQTIGPAVADQFTAQAIVALALSTLLVVIYVWVRFNSVRYSIASIVPTLIDCLSATGLIALAEIIYDASPGLAQSLGLLPFKIDLTVIASILTILGYSINDKIVVLDRIRENRGKLPFASRKVINDSINQTMSRTLMTGSTTILSTFILYLVGGEAVRSFAYSLGLGVIIGTISSIALGAPLVWAKKYDREAAKV
ncbi:MAG: protein translocase subunit SecD [Phycisphaerales bacterium]|nr:protein translocase subunit SecD [Phycisphaerales bacterium]